MTTYKDTDLREALRRKYANTPQLPSDFMNRMHKASQSKPQRASTPLHYGRGWGWVCSIAAALLIAFLVLQPLSNSPRGEEDSLSSERKKENIGLATLPPKGGAGREAEKQIEVMAEVQLAPQPVKKQRKAVCKQSTLKEEPVLAQAELPIQEQGQDFEPMYAQTEENDKPYQTMQTVHISSDVVMHVIEASDMPAASTVPSVSELRARGLLLTNNVQQASQTTVKF